jgi:mRNA interferase RelE/StbE
MVKTVRYTPDALKALKRHGNMAARIMKAMRDYADNPAAHANNVKQLKGSTAMRLRVGGYRVIFEEAGAELVVTDLGPRGGIYE